MYYTRIFLEKMEKTHKKPVRIYSLPPNIQTRYLTNTSLEYYHYNHLLYTVLKTV